MQAANRTKVRRTIPATPLHSNSLQWSGADRPGGSPLATRRNSLTLFSCQSSALRQALALGLVTGTRSAEHSYAQPIASMLCGHQQQQCQQVARSNHVCKPCRLAASRSRTAEQPRVDATSGYWLESGCPYVCCCFADSCIASASRTVDAPTFRCPSGDQSEEMIRFGSCLDGNSVK
jgi:hypothetical protein